MDKNRDRSRGPDELAGANAIEMLKADHRAVKRLFEQFEKTRDSGARGSIVQKCLVELTVHAALEEELFYPACRRQLDEEGLLDEAAEEHHVAKLLIGELAGMKPSDQRYEAKFSVLCESVSHHIEEEESEILPRIESSGFDLESLGQEMAERKAELVEEVTPDNVGTIGGEAPSKVGGTPRSSAGRRGRGRATRRSQRGAGVKSRR